MGFNKCTYWISQIIRPCSLYAKNKMAVLRNTQYGLPNQYSMCRGHMTSMSKHGTGPNTCPKLALDCVMEWLMADVHTQENSITIEKIQNGWAQSDPRLRQHLIDPPRTLTPTYVGWLYRFPAASVKIAPPRKIMRSIPPLPIFPLILNLQFGHLPIRSRFSSRVDALFLPRIPHILRR